MISIAVFVCSVTCVSTWTSWLKPWSLVACIWLRVYLQGFDAIKSALKSPIIIIFLLASSASLSMMTENIWHAFHQITIYILVWISTLYYWKYSQEVSLTLISDKAWQSLTPKGFSSQHGCSFRVSLEFLSNFNSFFSHAILARYFFFAHLNDSLRCFRLSCTVAQLVQAGGNEVSLFSSVTSMHPCINPTKFQNKITEIYGRWTEFHKEIIISYSGGLEKYFAEVFWGKVPNSFFQQTLYRNLHSIVNTIHDVT